MTLNTRLVRRGDLLAFYGQTADGPAVFTVDPHDDVPEPELVAQAWYFLPSASDDRIWLTAVDPDSPDTDRALHAVWEIGLDGTVTSEAVTPPGGRWPVAAVEDGLLFQGDHELELWDPHRAAFAGTLPGPFPVATWGNRLVACGDCVRLHLIDLDAGTDRTVEALDAGSTFDGYGGAFSPDGRFAAVPTYNSESPTADRLVTFTLVDFERTTATIVPITPQPDNHVHVGWSSNSQWLLLNVGDKLWAYQRLRI